MVCLVISAVSQALCWSLYILWECRQVCQQVIYKSMEDRSVYVIPVTSWWQMQLSVSVEPSTAKSLHPPFFKIEVNKCRKRRVKCSLHIVSGKHWQLCVLGPFYRRGKLDVMKLAEGRNRTILAASMASFPNLFENFLKYWIGKCYTEHKLGISAFCAQAELGLSPAEHQLVFKFR